MFLGSVTNYRPVCTTKNQCACEGRKRRKSLSLEGAGYGCCELILMKHLCVYVSYFEGPDHKVAISNESRDSAVEEGSEGFGCTNAPPRDYLRPHLNRLQVPLVRTHESFTNFYAGKSTIGNYYFHIC